MGGCAWVQILGLRAGRHADKCCRHGLAPQGQGRARRKGFAEAPRAPRDRYKCAEMWRRTARGAAGTTGTAEGARTARGMTWQRRLARPERTRGREAKRRAAAAAAAQAAAWVAT